MMPVGRRGKEAENRGHPKAREKRFVAKIPIALSRPAGRERAVPQQAGLERTPTRSRHCNFWAAVIPAGDTGGGWAHKLNDNDPMAGSRIRFREFLVEVWVTLPEHLHVTLSVA
jgi:hypothetical protein